MQPEIKDQAHHWKIKEFKGITLFKAHFFDFVYCKHTHDDFALGVIEKGTQKFQHHGVTHFAPSHSIITVNPDEVHDGEPATKDGYQYRMVYVNPSIIAEILSEFSGLKPDFHFFKEPVTFDEQISLRLRHCLMLLERAPDNLLETQSSFIQTIADLFLRHSLPRQAFGRENKNKKIIVEACDYIHSMAKENISLEDIAREVGLSRFHFLRLFKDTTGLPPHAYLIQRRIELARKALENDYSISEAAIEVGFSDQSHLTRRFKANYGVTPGQYKKSLQNK